MIEMILTTVVIWAIGVGIFLVGYRVGWVFAREDVQAKLDALRPDREEEEEGDAA